MRSRHLPSKRWRRSYRCSGWPSSRSDRCWDGLCSADSSGSNFAGAAVQSNSIISALGFGLHRNSAHQACIATRIELLGRAVSVVPAASNHSGDHSPPGTGHGTAHPRPHSGAMHGVGMVLCAPPRSVGRSRPTSLPHPLAIFATRLIPFMGGLCARPRVWVSESNHVAPATESIGLRASADS